jgi:hypothetical protein
MPHAFLLAHLPFQGKNIQPCSKVPYVKRKRARKAMNSVSEGSQSNGLIAHGAGVRNVWFCHHCEAWHFGHYNKPKKGTR